MLGSGQYTLTSQPELDDESSKICVLVKLTDSSVRAIDEFLKSKNNGAKKPTITFQKDKGEIVLPIDSSASRSQPAASSAAESTYQLKKFLFTLSSIKESYKDTSASSECICFNDSKFKTVAPIEQKLNVLANDEVFLATKEKVNSGVEEEKKNSTKEIKPSGLIGNRNGPKATLAQPNINRIKHPTVMPPNSNIKTTPDSANKPRNPVLDRPIRERLVHMLAVRPFTRAEILLRLFKDTPNLANERDRETVDQVLQSVAILNAKTGAYELKYETMLNEVNDEWQFYSQTEKSYVKRAINKIKQGPPPSTQPTTSSQEPTAPLKAAGSSSIGVGGQKSTASAFMSLKHQSQTTNNNNKSNLASQFESAVESLDTSNSSVSGRSSWSSNNKISPTSKQQQQQQQKISARPSAAASATADQSIADLSISSSSNDSLSLSFNTSLPSLSLSMSSSKTRPAEKENHNHSSHQNDGDLSNSTPNPNKKAKFSSSTTSSSAAASYHHSNSSNRQSEIEAIELNECAKRYKKIQNDQQREQYLNDFNKYHDQYTELYSYLENLSKRFTSYQQEMSQKDENSDEYQEMKRRVQREYLALQANKEYIQKRERYWLLHVRLKHIEDQIRDWTMNDSANLSE